jgi:predicted membrane channel-forming protein YqfA (hemolysin III family)
VFIAYIVVAIVLGLGLAGSASAKIRKDERVTAGLTAAGVPLSWFVPLALLELAGTAGLLIGIWWRPLGIAAAIGVILYFIGAVFFHIRAKDLKGLPAPAALLVVGAVALTLGLASA